MCTHLPHYITSDKAECGWRRRLSYASGWQKEQNKSSNVCYRRALPRLLHEAGSVGSEEMCRGKRESGSSHSKSRPRSRRMCVGWRWSFSTAVSKRKRTVLLCICVRSLNVSACVQTWNLQVWVLHMQIGYHNTRMIVVIYIVYTGH